MAEIAERPEVTVGNLLATLGDEDFSIVAGTQGLDRVIRQRTVQRVGVALTGSTAHMEHDRVQLLGQAESLYLASQPTEARHSLLKQMVSVGFPTLVLSAGRPISEELRQLANENGFVLLWTQLASTEACTRLNEALATCLAPRETRHGVLLDVHGVGVLLLGKSGIGKSELGLELLAAGHRLVADDVVLLKQIDSKTVVGSAPELLRHHMEIRGLGILNIKDLFGAAAVRDRKRVELAVNLIDWGPDVECDRLGLDETTTLLAGTEVRLLTLPVRPGRSLALLIEVAARNHLLQQLGHSSARTLADRLHYQMNRANFPIYDSLANEGERGIE